MFIYFIKIIKLIKSKIIFSYKFFNIASFNDYATGRGRPTMTTAMGNSTYTVIATNGGSGYPYQGWVVDTNTFEASTVNASANFSDGYNNAAIFGDLA